MRIETIDAGDHYAASSYIVGDDMNISMDKRLHIHGHLFVSGSLTSNVDILVEGTVVVNGKADIQGIQGKRIKMLGRNYIDGDVVVKESGIFGATHIEGSVIGSGNIAFLSDTTISENLGVSGTMESNGKIYVGGTIHVSGVFEARGVVSSPNKATINHIECSDFGRLVHGENILLFYGEGLTIIRGDGSNKHLKLPINTEHCCAADKKLYGLARDKNIATVIKNSIIA